MRDVEEAVRILLRAGLSLKLSMCHFVRKEVEYLGHVIRPGTLELNKTRLKSLKNVKSLRTPTQLRSFLGSVQHFSSVHRMICEDREPLDGAAARKCAGPIAETHRGASVYLSEAHQCLMLAVCLALVQDRPFAFR